jgi:hypothetical protein
MSNGRFIILLRRRQNQVNGDNVVIEESPITGYAQYVPGNVDNITPFSGIVPDPDGFYDLTEYIEPDSAFKLSLTWDKINSGNSTNATTNPDGSNFDKGISSEFDFFDKSYAFVYDWLLSKRFSTLNTIDVKIIDLITGGTYRMFEIKADNIEYAPVDEPCQLHIKLREADPVWSCVHKTFIFDNHQHWFEDSNLKAHPCFLTCIEPRPRLIQSVRMGLLMLIHSNPAVALIELTFGQLFGDRTENARKILNANRFVDAPLVRTYIQNVADKCGLSMDTIFDVGQEWENLCLYYPQAGFMHESNADSVSSPSRAYHYDNRWLITLPELLDKLKNLFCAEWFVTPNNTITFKHTKDLINLDPIYDFTADDAVPIYDLRYTFNGEKKAAYGRYEYQTDGSDLASQEIGTLYNDIIDYDGQANNYLLEGQKTKTFEFAPTGFVRDGRAQDYMSLLINDGKTAAMVVVMMLAVIALVMTETSLAYLVAAAGPLATAVSILVYMGIWLGLMGARKNELEDTFISPTYTGAVRLTSEQVLTPRLILWDGLRTDRAKAEANAILPTANPFYNPDLTAYDVKNKIDIDNPDHLIYNYPLYFDGDFTGNLFDRYHDTIDNPLKSLETNQDAKWNVDLCEDMLNRFGVFEGQYVQIGKVVKLEDRDNYDVFVRIGNINVDYDNNKINFKGPVIRRVNTPVVDISCHTFQVNGRCLVINGSYININ